MPKTYEDFTIAREALRKRLSEFCVAAIDVADMEDSTPSRPMRISSKRRARILGALIDNAAGLLADDCRQMFAAMEDALHDHDPENGPFKFAVGLRSVIEDGQTAKTRLSYSRTYASDTAAAIAPDATPDMFGGESEARP